MHVVGFGFRTDRWRLLFRLHLLVGELLGHPGVCQSSPFNLYGTVSRDLREMGGYL